METQDNGFLLVIDGVRKEKERLTAAKLLYCLTKIIEKLGNKKQRVPGPDNTMQRWRIGYEGLKRRWKRKSSVTAGKTWLINSSSSWLVFDKLREKSDGKLYKNQMKRSSLWELPGVNLLFFSKR